MNESSAFDVKGECEECEGLFGEHAMIDDAERSMAESGKLASACKVWDRQDGQPARHPSEGAAASLSSPKLVECGSLRWYVARTRPWQDQKATRALRLAGFAAHAFRVEEQPRRQHAVLRPLFPGFLFVRAVVAKGQIGRILRLDGTDGLPMVTGILANPDGVPLPVPDEQMQLFLDHADGKDIWTEPGAVVVPASAVGGAFEVKVGPWARFVGTCIRDERGRIDLEMTLFGRQSVLTLRRDQAERVT